MGMESEGDKQGENGMHAKQENKPRSEIDREEAPKLLSKEIQQLPDGTEQEVNFAKINHEQQEFLQDEEYKDETIAVEQENMHVPDGGWGWFVVLGSSIVHAIIGGFERSNGVMYLQLLARFNRGSIATAWVLSLFSTLRLAMGPLASVLCNKFSCRFVVLLGTAISCFGVLVSGFMSDLSYLYFTYGILGGVGRAFVYTPGLIIIGNYFNKKRGIAVGLATSGVAFGSFILPPLTELLFNEYGFTGTFIILSGIMGNFFVCGFLFRPLELHRRLMFLDRRKSCTLDMITTNKLVPSRTTQNTALTEPNKLIALSPREMPKEAKEREQNFEQGLKNLISLQTVLRKGTVC